MDAVYTQRYHILGYKMSASIEQVAIIRMLLYPFQTVDVSQELFFAKTSLICNIEKKYCIQLPPQVYTQLPQPFHLTSRVINWMVLK